MAEVNAAKIATRRNSSIDTKKMPSPIVKAPQAKVRAAATISTIPTRKYAQRFFSPTSSIWLFSLPGYLELCAWTKTSKTGHGYHGCRSHQREQISPCQALLSNIFKSSRTYRTLRILSSLQARKGLLLFRLHRLHCMSPLVTVLRHLKMVQNGSKWFKMAANGSKWFKWVKMVQNGLKLFLVGDVNRYNRCWSV